MESLSAEVTIGSLDAIALYPSLKLDETINILTNVILKSKLEFEGIEWQELSKYLAIVCSREELEKYNLLKHILRRYTSKGTPTLQYLLSD